MNKITVCFSPTMLAQYEHKDSVVVVTDVFRATTTMCVAFSNGCKEIIPVATEDEAKDYKNKGYLVGAEKETERCVFADFGNSPAEYYAEKVKGKTIVMKTTNGTVAINGAKDCHSLLIGAFVNLNAVAQKCKELNRDVLIVCSGQNLNISLEDSLFAGALTSLLQEADFFIVQDDARIALTLWQQARNILRKFAVQGEHAQRLIRHGFEKDIDICLSQSTLDIVPVLKENKLIIE